ncbi:ABC transporter permease [Aeoliella sp. ICT_H6.2]|uniref:ABC transporter permease n=1 Tax=Aeoliella straminimaris TaxID=2954799 RepID=A0A9X2FDR1_9BACT|nr:ABC transporter permease [Aeoliella straminimaris]MCO6044001.1 ABC transporter permease [Aeoliella straminimaris]
MADDKKAPDPPKPAPKSPGFWRETWVRFRRRPGGMLALVYVVFMALVAIFAPAIAGTKPVMCKYKGHLYFPAMGYFNPKWENPIFQKDRFRKRYTPAKFKEKDPDSWVIWPLVYQDPFRRVGGEEWPGQPENPTGADGSPSRYNWFGTNQQGKDVFAMMVHGTRIALLVGFVSMGIAATVGITFGAIAGYFGGWTDIIISRLIEVVLCIPALVLILALLAIVEKATIWHIMAVIGLTRWTGIARLTRAEFLRLKQSDYVAAAKSLGASQLRIVFKHILRNGLAPVLVPITFGIASAVLLESGLSLLGFGTPPPNPSWGTILREGRDTIQQTWWLIVFPGLAIFFTVLAYNLIGEGLQEATDPRLRSDD